MTSGATLALTNNISVNEGAFTVIGSGVASTPAVSSNAINVGDTMTIDSDGRFDLNNLSESIKSLAGTGQIDLGTTGALTIGVNSGNSTFGGSILGSGTLIKDGSGSLTLAASLAITGELQLDQGTIYLGGANLTAGTLRITGNSTIDFAGGNSILSATNFIIDAGITLTIANWTDAADFFYAQNWTGASFDASGSAPMNQVAFATFNANNTKWQSIDSQVTPVPEPATYGAMLLGLMIFLRFKFHGLRLAWTERFTH